jgi:hypothetical protein
MLSPEALAELGRSLDLLQRLVATLRDETSLAVEERVSEDDASEEDQTASSSQDMSRYDLTGVGA